MGRGGGSVGVEPPVIGEFAGFGGGERDDGAVLGAGEVDGLHDAFVELSEGREGFEIGRLAEAEVVRLGAVGVIHEHPLVLADALPDIGRFAGLGLGVDPGRIVNVARGERVGDGVFDAGSAVVRDVGEVKFFADLDDVAVDVGDVFGILEEQLGLGLEFGERVVHVGVVEPVAAVAEAHGEMHHHLFCLLVVNRFGCPGAADVFEAGEGLVHANLGVRPVDEVGGLHEDEAAVVTPAEALVALPLGGAEAFPLR